MSASYLSALHADTNGATAESSSSSHRDGEKASGHETLPSANGNSAQPVDLDSDAAFPALGMAAAPSGKGKRAVNGSRTGPPQAAATGWAGAASAGSFAEQANGNGAHYASSAASARPIQHTDSLIVPASALALSSVALPASSLPAKRRNEDAQPTTLKEAVTAVYKQFPAVKIESSSSKNNTTFLFRGPSEDQVRAAKSSLAAKVTKKVGNFKTVLCLAF